jgi:hypothetical protein
LPRWAQKIDATSALQFVAKLPLPVLATLFLLSRMRLLIGSPLKKVAKQSLSVRISGRHV